MITGAVGPGDHDRNSGSIYVVSVLGGTVRRVGDGGAQGELSPDGTRMVFMVPDPDRDSFSIGLADANGENPREFIESGPGEWRISPTWSPDGKRIVYRYRRSGEGTVNIESRGLDDETSIVLVRERAPLIDDMASALDVLRAEDFLMLEGRLVFARDEPPPRSDRNLWALAVNPGSGEPRGEPRRLIDWVGLEINGLSATADGSRLAFRDDHTQTDVWVGELNEGGRALGNVRRLTLDDRKDTPRCWTPDGHAVVFGSERYGSRDLLVQDLDKRDARDLVVGPGMQDYAGPTPDGAFFVYGDLGDSGKDVRVRRVPVGGGAPELLAELRAPLNLRCGDMPEGPCVLGEQRAEDGRLTWSRFDPVSGRGEELWQEERGPTDPQVWDYSLSPDGGRLAAGSGTDIVIKEVPSGRTSRIPVKGLPGFATGLAWAPDGQGFYVTSASLPGGALLYVDLKGTAHLLHHVPDFGGISAPTPSRDGRHLAFGQVTRESNVWWVEQF